MTDSTRPERQTEEMEAKWRKHAEQAHYLRNHLEERVRQIGKRQNALYHESRTLKADLIRSDLGFASHQVASMLQTLTRSAGD